jgi:hypothetical protein
LRRHKKFLIGARLLRVKGGRKPEHRLRFFFGPKADTWVSNTDRQSALGLFAGVAFEEASSALLAD